jgi:acetyltransferase-like isoleucine patch superfamily enzyme
VRHAGGVPSPPSPPNPVRRGSTNRAARAAADAVMVPPVRLYGEAKVESGCTIGKYTYVGTRSQIANADVGSYCAIARAVEIGAKPHPTTFLSIHPFQYERTHFTDQPGYGHPIAEWQTVSPATRTTVGDDVWIGTKATIGHSVRVGTGAVVGAHAVVTADVPPYAIVGGVPARIIRHRFDEALIARLLDSRWWLLDPVDLADIDVTDVPAAVEEVVRRRAGWAAQVAEALRGPLVNDEDRTGEGVLWFDVERSYAVPEVVEAFTEVVVEASAVPDLPVGRHPIVESWFDPVTTSFGIWTGAPAAHLPAGALRFRLA